MSELEQNRLAHEGQLEQLKTKIIENKFEDLSRKKDQVRLESFWSEMFRCALILIELCSKMMMPKRVNERPYTGFDFDFKFYFVVVAVCLSMQVYMEQ